eukprot:scaffold18020_cov49-Prasinocladus_malaysianus.AAC.1
MHLRVGGPRDQARPVGRKKSLGGLGPLPGRMSGGHGPPHGLRLGRGRVRSGPHEWGVMGPRTGSV